MSKALLFLEHVKRVKLQEKYDYDVITSRTLKTVLYEKGLNQYQNSIRVLDNKLDRYKAVANLPASVTITNLEALANELMQISLMIDELTANLKQ